MKHLKLFLVTIICLTACKEPKQIKAQNTKPNIIFILADDFGIVDTQGYAEKITGISKGSMFYETPNLNKLMEEGVSFSQAYANQLCSPTRASLLTGKYAGRLGFTTAMPPRKTYYNQNIPVPNGFYPNDVLEHKDAITIEQALDNGISNAAIPAGTQMDNGHNEISIAEALTDYHSAFIGKWHVGGFGAQGYQPKDQGFEPLAWFDAGGSPYYNWKAAWNEKKKTRFPKMPQTTSEMGNSGQDTGETYLTDDLTIQALNYIEKRSKLKDQPFFLYFSHFALHAPYQGKEKEVAYFNNKKTKGWNGHKDPIYASMIKSMDRSVGQILNKLKETGIEENTLVVFMSDNGGIDSKITPRGDGTDNRPFLGGKACLTEGGIRVPLIFKWKGKIKGGNWVDVPIDCTDIYPTILEAAGYDFNAMISENKLDGQSILTLLTDNQNVAKSYTKKTHYWHYPFNVIYNSPYEPYALTPHSAIRDGDYKLIFDWYGRIRLYNIEEDPFEKHDLSIQNKELSNVLFAKLMGWIKNNIEPRYWPVINEDYNAQKEVREIPFKDLFSSYLKH